jgi:hypothetical protein
MLKPIRIDYDFTKIITADYTQHHGSCINHQIHELTDIHKSYGGFPKSYCFENTKIHQLWWDNTQLDFVELGNQLGIEIITISSILQEPGCVVPLHRDTFYQINQKYPNRQEPKVRANIYLEDYQIGQFIQYQTDTGYKISIDWRAGDGFMWDSTVLHLSAKAGMKNKLTLQISGFLKQ